MKTPTKKKIRAAREAANHTRTEAAETIYKSLRSWEKWESGDRPMDPAFFELYLIKTGQKVAA